VHVSSMENFEPLKDGINVRYVPVQSMDQSEDVH
jgi:hypothetical protein